MPKPDSNTVPLPKHERVFRALRAGILQGQLGRGRQLPPNTVLARRHHVSVATLQLALNHLAREGFVEVRPRKGTFVCETLPDHALYALVFHNEPASPTWSWYYSALTNAAVSLERTAGKKFMFFHGVDQHHDNEDAQRLLGFMRADRLSGMIFANSPQPVIGLPLLEESGIPRVAIMGQQVFPQVTAVGLGMHELYVRAVDHLLARGRKRLATITNDMAAGVREDRTAILIARGLVSPLCWYQYVHSSQPSAARNCVELLMRGHAAERPDALLILDDNLVGQSLAGLLAAGVRVPEEVEVVAHCNFPWAQPSVLPVRRIGFDIIHTLRTCVGLIDRQRRGERVPGLTTMPPLFEEELERYPVRANGTPEPSARTAETIWLPSERSAAHREAI